eukprot:TRINITY_DN29138_c0_g1_i1.p1 TRINITY_DN29138_c0_g1~~TRINITY_DN29138_c0_g1_i1.p1  ORF type:complete len:699 (-),score=85.93 TRINITY_DN29138_c0_g1_i1:90-1892(-)
MQDLHCTVQKGQRCVPSLACAIPPRSPRSLNTSREGASADEVGSGIGSPRGSPHHKSWYNTEIDMSPRMSSHKGVIRSKIAWELPRDRQRSSWSRTATSDEDALSGDEWVALLEDCCSSDADPRDLGFSDATRSPCEWGSSTRRFLEVTISKLSIWPKITRLHRVVQEYVHSPTFDVMACALVAGSALLLGLEADYAARNVATSALPVVYTISDRVFTFLFTTELVLRVSSDGFRSYFYSSPDVLWNCFDTVVVSLQLVDTLMDCFTSKMSAAGDASRSVLRLARSVRIIRIARVLRMLHLVDDLRSMVRSIAVSCRSLVWAMMLLVILIYMLGVCLIQIVTDHRKGLPPDDMIQDNVDMERIYGDLSSTCMMLWQCISGGVDWNTAMDPLVRQISGYLALVFVAYIAFSLMAMMNVTTGILVDRVMEDAKKNLAITFSTRMREFFKTCRKNTHGQITWEVFESKLEDEQLISIFHMLNTDIACARGIFKLMDTGDTDAIDPDDLVDGWLRMRGEAKALDLALFMHEMERVNTHICSKLGKIERNFAKLDKNKSTEASSRRRSVYNHQKSLIQTSCLFSRAKGRVFSDDEVCRDELDNSP